MDKTRGVYLACLCVVIIKIQGATQNKPSQTTLVTERFKSGMMGTEVILKCSFMTSKPWYVMQWKKWNKDGIAVTLVTLQRPMDKSIPFTPSWSTGQEVGRGTFIHENESAIVFNLRINQFTCDDVGMYECSVIDDSRHRSITNLSIKASPKPPKIHQDILIVDANYTFTLECFAVVGLPPRGVYWYRKYPEDKMFHSVTEGTETEIQQSQSCVPYIKRTLAASITEAMSGTIYRCQVDGANYVDEIEIRLPDKVVTDPPYAVNPCDGDKCSQPVVRGQGDSGVAALRFSSVFFTVHIVITMCLVFIS